MSDSTKPSDNLAEHSDQSLDAQDRTSRDSNRFRKVISDPIVRGSTSKSDEVIQVPVPADGAQEAETFSGKSSLRSQPKRSFSGWFAKNSLSKTVDVPDETEVQEKPRDRPVVVTFQDNSPTEAEYFHLYKKFNTCNVWLTLVVIATLTSQIAIFFLTTPLRYGEFLNMMLVTVGSSKYIPDINCSMSTNFMRDFSGIIKVSSNIVISNLGRRTGGSGHNNMTIISDYECPRNNLVQEVFSLEFGGHFIGVSISGICGDIYGRRTVAVFASILWTAAMFGLCFFSSITSIKYSYFLSCIAGMTMAFMFYINLMEIAPRRLRMFVMYLMHMHYMAALMAELVIRYAEVDWRRFQYCNAACLPVILFTVWYIPESPYWLWNKSKKRKAFEFLHEVSPSEESQIGMAEQTNAPYNKLWPALAEMMAIVFCDKLKRRPFWLFILMTFVGSVISSISTWKLKFFEFYSNDFRIISMVAVGVSGLLVIPIVKFFEKKMGQVVIYVLSSFAALGILAIPVEKMQVYYNVFQIVLTLCSVHLIWYMMVDFFPTCVRATTIAFSFQIYFVVQLMVINTIYYWMQRVAREVSYALQFCTALAGFTILFLPEHQTIYLPNQKLDYV